MGNISQYLLSYPCGLICIIIGILKLRAQYKNKFDFDDSPLYPHLDGWAWGIGIIILGVLIIMFKFQGKI